jgi:protein-S-isoprenylcysteine O-methyltransferase Ste14
VKVSRLKKLSWKLLFTFSLVIVLIILANPAKPLVKLAAWHFWTGVAFLILAQWIRLWAAGHLVKNKVLTVTGPYAYVKNPLYIGTFFGMVGFAFVAMGDPSQPAWYFRYANWLALGLGVLVFVAYYIPYKKKREGDRLHDIFGEPWDHYDKAVPDYFPKFTRYERAENRPWSWAATCENSEQWTPPAILAGLLAVLFNGAVLEQVNKLVK